MEKVAISKYALIAAQVNSDKSTLLTLSCPFPHSIYKCLRDLKKYKHIKPKFYKSSVSNVI